ncbi:hypothetical protein ISREJYDI_CDS0015 [Pseudomonas phage UNO-G1W1]|uniref:Transcriptional regulator n=1 Tax=Pseudomonas phage UNO-G1W1 TaxID=3136609 RepID=A0AAX4MU30_9CAUD
MAGIRRPPKAPSKPKAKARPPIHQRILGRAAVEVDTLADLELELEKALELDLIEYDTYLDCKEALQIRQAKAKEGLDKATGRYVKPDKKVDIHARSVRRCPLTLNQKKVIFVVLFLIFLKFFC